MSKINGINTKTYIFKREGETYKLTGVPYEEKLGMRYYPKEVAQKLVEYSKYMITNGVNTYEYGNADKGLYTLESLLEVGISTGINSSKDGTELRNRYEGQERRTGTY